MDVLDTVIANAIQQFDLIAPVQVVAQFPSVNHQSIQLRAANGDFVIKVYATDQDEATRRYEHMLVQWLSWRPASFTVPLPLRGRSIDYSHYNYNSDRFYSITPYIAGETPDFRVGTDDQYHPLIQQWAYSMGTALGELQTILQARPAQQRRPLALFQSLLTYAQPRYDPLQLSAAQVGGSSDDEALWTWWRMEATSLMAFVTNEYPSLPQQLCHNDFAPSNLLMRDGRVAAILDFEFACPAARALDVAMALRMIMQLDSNPANPWAVAAQFCCGYAEWITLTAPEIAAMPQLIGLRTAIPVIWAVSKTERPSPTSLVQAIRRMQVSKAWMSQHHPQLIALLQTAFAA
ncbi:MAG: phosphotransferase [Chloroflexi bacterium]|nr:phosphotransferase [Chloroflexota bacterium]